MYNAKKIKNLAKIFLISTSLITTAAVPLNAMALLGLGTKAKALHESTKVFSPKISAEFKSIFDNWEKTPETTKNIKKFIDEAYTKCFNELEILGKGSSVEEIKKYRAQLSDAEARLKKLNDKKKTKKKESLEDQRKNQQNLINTAKDCIESSTILRIEIDREFAELLAEANFAKLLAEANKEVVKGLSETVTAESLKARVKASKLSDSIKEALEKKLDEIKTSTTNAQEDPTSNSVAHGAIPTRIPSASNEKKGVNKLTNIEKNYTKDLNPISNTNSSFSSSWEQAAYELNNKSNEKQRSNESSSKSTVNSINQGKSLPARPGSAPIASNNITSKKTDSVVGQTKRVITKAAIVTGIVAKSVKRHVSDMTQGLKNKLNHTIAAIASSGDDEFSVQHGLWMSGTYGINNQGKYHGRVPYEGSMAEGTIGFDLGLENGTILGIAVSMMDSKLLYKDKDTTSNSSNSVALYANKNLFSSRFSLQAIAQLNSSKIKHVDREPGVADKNITGDVMTYSVNTTLSYRYVTKLGLVITPHIGVDYSQHQGDLYQQNVKITKDSLNKKGDYWAGEVGAKLAIPFCTKKKGFIITPSLTADVRKYLSELKKSSGNNKYHVEAALSVKRSKVEVGLECDHNWDDKGYASTAGTLKLKVLL